MSDVATAAPPGSARTALAGVETLGPVDPATTVEFTVALRRRAELPEDLVIGPGAVSSRELTEQYGADPADLELVVSTLESAGATILEQHPARVGCGQAHPRPSRSGCSTPSWCG